MFELGRRLYYQGIAITQVLNTHDQLDFRVFTLGLHGFLSCTHESGLSNQRTRRITDQIAPENGHLPLGVGNLVILPCAIGFYRFLEPLKVPALQDPQRQAPSGVEGTLVGRAMIMTDQQLRTYNILNPWSREAATDHIPEALEDWGTENSSPPLDLHPVLSGCASSSLNDLLNAIPPEESPFSFDQWKSIGELTDSFIASTGGVFTAAHAYISFWGKTRSPTTLTPGVCVHV